MVQGECPPAKDGCGTCEFVAARREILGNG